MHIVCKPASTTKIESNYNIVMKILKRRSNLSHLDYRLSRRSR